MNQPTSVDFSTLLASSVHDIKNSVGLLLHSLDEVIDDAPPEFDGNNKQFSILRRESARINNALISLLGLYRVSEGQVSPVIHEIYLLDFLKEQVAAQKLLFDINNISIDLHCDETLVGYFDENLIAGVIGNVLVNGAKYTKDKISLCAYFEAPYTVIKITDNGSGYPQGIIDNIENHERSVDFSSGSTSLGLYFAQQMAAIHSNQDLPGCIELSNTSEGFACFCLKLP